MAEAAAAFYTVETAVEGAAVGAFAVSRATVPVAVRFHKINSPSPSLTRSSHSLSYHRGRVFIFGGDTENGNGDNSMHVVTLPSDLALSDIDYQVIEAQPAPVRPLADTSSDKPSPEQSKGSSSNITPIPRAAHASTTVGSNIYIFGGRAPGTSSHSAETALIDEAGTVHAFSTIDNKWTTLIPHSIPGVSGVPQPRTYASMTSSPHPSPKENLETTAEGYGTLFLHGGYNANGELLRDTWTFDVGSRIWNRWPDLPSPGVEEVAGEGRIHCTENRLWRVGDGFGKMEYVEISRDIANDMSGKTELGVSPKTGQWEVLSFGNTAVSEAKEGGSGKKGPTSRADTLPIPRRGAGFLPVTTGAGREFLLYFMGEDAPGSTVPDIWTFQIASDEHSPAVMKDKVRRIFGAGTGENQWARCDVVQHSKEEGELERPQGLSRFAADAWSDFGGGAAVVWGGRTDGGQTKNEGWVLTVE